MKRWTAALVTAVAATALGAALLPGPLADTASSNCVGTPDHGRLENGVRLPSRGANFSSYSGLGIALGRNFVHDKVRSAVVDAYAQLEQAAPGTVFVYGETGFARGGPFKPHKTHQNGTSVDFMVPVMKSGRSVAIPSSPLNKFGYALEFDRSGRMGKYVIDFEALARHLLALDDAAGKHGVKIRRVIFDVPLQGLLFRTEAGTRLKSRMSFSQRASWVRHDEHYHVDFEVPCERP